MQPFQFTKFDLKLVDYWRKIIVIFMNSHMKMLKYDLWKVTLHF